VAYSYPEIESPWKRAAAQKIQPMGFSGRCEAIMAPTTENATVRVAIMTMPSSTKISPNVRPLRRAKIRLAAARPTHSRHRVQASRVTTFLRFVSIGIDHDR
jgi:hypothetical protein